MNEDIEVINLTPNNIADYGVCGYKDVKKHIELRRKIEWVKEFYPKGLRIKAIMSKTGGYQGMIEYINGEYTHRPVNASNYIFIHCLFVGFKKKYKGKGLATMLINECIEEAKENKMSGVCVVTRSGSFMAKKDIFLKMGFKLIEEAKPDFELLALKFDDSVNPSFKDMNKGLSKYKNGLTIIRSVQCPYTEKNVNEIIKSAKELYNLDVNLVEIKSAQEAQEVPCPFGTFSIIYNGGIISYSPISNTRFINIMNKTIKAKN